MQNLRIGTVRHAGGLDEGELVEMFRHLKIGVDENVAKTIRVHFHWDSKREKIVIGYCGEHFPVSSH